MARKDYAVKKFNTQMNVYNYLTFNFNLLDHLPAIKIDRTEDVVKL